MQISNTFAACLWKSLLVWGNIISLNGSGWSLRFCVVGIILSREVLSQPLVKNLRNGESSFVENCSQNFYLSCLQRFGNLAGELSPGGIRLDDHDQPVGQPSQGHGVAVLTKGQARR